MFLTGLPYAQQQEEPIMILQAVSGFIGLFGPTYYFVLLSFFLFYYYCLCAHIFFQTISTSGRQISFFLKIMHLACRRWRKD